MPLQLIALTSAMSFGGMSDHSRIETTFASRKLRHIHRVAHRSIQMPVILAITNTFVHHAVSNAVGVRRRRARDSNAEAPRSKSFVLNPSNSKRRGTRADEGKSQAERSEYADCGRRLPLVGSVRRLPWKDHTQCRIRFLGKVAL